jgi:hypothetical protein
MTDLIAVRWSADDGEFVATHHTYPSLSWLDPDPSQARAGLSRLIADIEWQPWLI